MARIRSIHPGIFTDEAFLELSDAARVLVFGLWCEADDNGVFEWKVKTLKARIRPVDSENVNELLAELVGNNFLLRFEADGKSYGAIRNFRRYQRPKKPKGWHPLPEDVAVYVGLGSEPGASEGGGGSEPNGDEGGSNSEPVGNQFRTGGENRSQMEDGGWRMEEPPLSPPSAKSRSGGKRGTRLPTGFTVPPDWIAHGHAAREKHRLPPANLELEAENFVAYWAAKSGKDATKLDWHATWLTWCRRANTNGAQQPRAGPNGHQADFLDGEIRQWKHRMNGFNQSGFWLNDQWGPPPGKPGCQVPRELVDGDAA